ncbi:unnamed protein product [Urochloa humidicola]
MTGGLTGALGGIRRLTTTRGPSPCPPSPSSIRSAPRSTVTIMVPSPLRRLRVALDAFDTADTASVTAVDGWLSYAVHQAAAGELRIDLRLGYAPLCARAYALCHRDAVPTDLLPLDIEVDDDDEDYLSPASNTPDRCTCTPCQEASSPASPCAASRIRVRRRRAGPLVPDIARHSSGVIVHTELLRRGGQGPEGDARLRDFLGIFAGVTKLQLKSARLGSYIGQKIMSSKLEFPALRNLELTGMLPEDDIATVSAVTRILQRTPSLQTLSMLFLPEPEVRGQQCHDEGSLRASHKLRHIQYMTLSVPDCEEVPFLREQLREINLVHYHGSMAQRMLAILLLCKTPVIDEVYCKFAWGPLFIQTKLIEEIKGWILNKSANMMFF